MADLIADLAKSDRLYLIVKEFAAVDLHPNVISGHDMGYIFEELIRKFAESNNAQAGDHFTPREVIALMVDILFHTEDDALTKPGTVRTIYDPAGTGGMLSTAYDHLIAMNPKARPVLYGQDINPRSYAMRKSDMIIKRQDVDNIYFGDTLVDASAPRPLTSCCPTRRTASPGTPSRRRSLTNTSSGASQGASVQACPAFRTGRCCSCCTSSPRCSP
jgi:type I restriction enzyme M protein